MESLLSLDPRIARESPIYPMNRFDPWKGKQLNIEKVRRAEAMVPAIPV